MELLNKWVKNQKNYSQDTTSNTVMGTGKQNHNRNMQPVVGKHA